jgi:5'-deoxynucleotidase YfbR-like HD superfamily hydrolase
MIRSAGYTKRFHTVQIIGEQTVAEHSYHVAMLCVRLSYGSPSSDLLMAALYHDLAETVTGDIPAPAKWRYPGLKNELLKIESEFEDEYFLNSDLTNNEILILKHADGLELASFCIDQIMLGNKNMIIIYHNITQFLETLKKPEGSIYDEIFEEIRERFFDAIK